MIILNDVLKFLKATVPYFDHYYIGKLVNKNNNSLGIYNLNKNNNLNIAIGGEENTKIRSKNISLLVHGNKNKTQTETLAIKTFETLKIIRNGKIGEHEINYIKLSYDEPIDVDQDSNGIYEYVIELQIYYK